MKNLKVWMNGKFVDIDKARISIFDRGFLYGDGIFETMRSYAGVIFRLDEHLDRLFKALKVMRIKPPYSKIYFKKVICGTLRINGLKSAYIRFTMTRGEGRFGLNYSDTFKPNVLIMAKEFSEYPAAMYKRGISADIVAARQNEYSPVSGVKSLNFLNYILARFEAKKRGFDEAILMNTGGHVAEGATSNIFLAKRGVLITPLLESGILPGITRGVVIDIARRLRLRLREKLVSYKELLAADEAFLTNSLMEILPVTKIGKRCIGAGHPGDITKLLHISYQKKVIKEVLF